MMHISLAGLIGAIIGTVIAAVIYYLIAEPVDRLLRATQPLDSAEDRDAHAARMALLRRSVLTVDLAICAAGGYWLADRMWG